MLEVEQFYCLSRLRLCRAPCVVYNSYCQPDYKIVLVKWLYIYNRCFPPFKNKLYTLSFQCMFCTFQIDLL